MKTTIIILFWIVVLFSGCGGAAKVTTGEPLYSSPSLSLISIAPDVYQHISYLQTDDFGKVPCNGMVVINGNEAIVFDTPADTAASVQLINWLEDSLTTRIVAVVPTHFHNDCLGGLNQFHNRRVTSYANNLTVELAKKNHAPVPQRGFDEAVELEVGAAKVSVAFLGEGHTRDNVVAYYAREKVLFGGCLIKEVGAGKGFVGDANQVDWSSTVQKVKGKYPNVKIVIPGHGRIGGTDLFDYTIQLFQQ